MKKYTKTYMGYKFEIIGSRGQGYEVSYKGWEAGYADTLKEAYEVIQQVVCNGIGDKKIHEF